MCDRPPLWLIAALADWSHRLASQLAEREIMVTVPSDRTGDKVIRLSSYNSNRGHPCDATSPYNRSDAEKKRSQQDENSLT
jgi:hypothetical protein